MLNTYQQEKYNKFIDRINNNKSLIFSSKYRAVGKTYLLNEIALELQALGYKVLLMSPYNHMDFYAEKVISNDVNSFNGIIDNNTIIIVDEMKRVVMDEFLDYCDDRKVSVIGFVNYGEKDDIELYKTLFK